MERGGENPLKSWIAAGILLGLITVALPLIALNPSILTPQLIGEQASTAGSVASQPLDKAPSSNRTIAGDTFLTENGSVAELSAAGSLVTPLEQGGIERAIPAIGLSGGGATFAPFTVALNLSIILGLGGSVGIVAFIASKIHLKRSRDRSAHG